MFQTRPRPGVLTLGISLAIVKSPTLKGITERGLLDPGFGYERSRGMAEGLGKRQKGSLSFSFGVSSNEFQRILPRLVPVPRRG